MHQQQTQLHYQEHLPQQSPAPHRKRRGQPRPRHPPRQLAAGRRPRLGRQPHGEPAGRRASVTDEIERVLDAIRERRGAAPATMPAMTSATSPCLRRHARCPRAARRQPGGRSGQPARSAPAPAAATSGPPRGRARPATDGFADIQAHSLTCGRPRAARPRPARPQRRPPGGTDASVAHALNQAAAEARRAPAVSGHSRMAADRAPSAAPPAT